MADEQTSFPPICPIPTMPPMRKNVSADQVKYEVLNAIEKYKCISAAELSYWLCIPIPQVQTAIEALAHKREIFLSDGGSFPKRWKPRVIKEDIFDYDTRE